MARRSFAPARLSICTTLALVFFLLSGVAQAAPSSRQSPDSPSVAVTDAHRQMPWAAPSQGPLARPPLLPRVHSEELLPPEVASQAAHGSAEVSLSGTGLGSISGTVTDNATPPVPLKDVCVDALDPTTGDKVSGVTTASDGTYSIGGLPSGPYVVAFSPPWCGGSGTVTQYYNNEPTFDAANAVTVRVGVPATGIDAALALAGSISGTVTDDATKTPLEGICVLAGIPPTSAGGAWTWGGVTTTDPEGKYSFGGLLPSGDWVVEFGTWSWCGGSGDYAFEFYSNKFTYEAATPVTVTAGEEHEGIDAALALAGSISGIVTDEADPSKHLEGVCVDAWTEKGWWEESATTDQYGKYSIGGLASGDYAVRFSDNCDDSVNYGTQYYDNKLT